MTKRYRLKSLVTFTRNEVCGTHLVFQKKRFQGFISEILKMVRVSLLGEKFIFLKLPWDNQISTISTILCILTLSFS